MKPLLKTLVAALRHTNVRAIMAVIREGESAQTDDAYRWLFGSTKSKPRLAADLHDHPRERTYEKYDGQFIRNGKLDYTTAAGAYQITETTWDTVIQPALALPDFSPASQDLAAAFLLHHRKALPLLLEGRVREAIARLTPEWASLPGAAHGDQPTLAMERALRVYAAHGGTFAPAEAPAEAPTSGQDGPGLGERDVAQASPAPAEAPGPTFPTEWDLNQHPQETPTMPIPAVISALLPALIEQAPQLIRIFGSGGATSERNAKAAERVAEIARTVTDQPTTEGAVNALQNSPDVAAAYRERIHLSMTELMGVAERLEAAERAAHDRAEESRDRAASRAAGEEWDMAKWLVLGAFAMIGILLLFVCGIAIVQAVKGDIKAEVWAQVAGLIGFATGVGTTIFAYRFGTSKSSANKDFIIENISRRGARVE